MTTDISRLSGSVVSGQWSVVSGHQQGIIALLIGIVAMFVASLLSLSAVFVFLNRAEASRNTVYSYESIYAAESGIEDMLLRYFDPTKIMPSSYPITLSVGNAVATTTLSEDLIGNATITSEGTRRSRIRELIIYAIPSPTGVFNYAVQIGEGGLEMESNSTVIGTVYSNGNIDGNESGASIDGDAYAVTTISSPRPTVTGSKNEGAAPKNLPSIDVDYWKARANINNDPYIGNMEISGPNNTLGPRKIQGDLTIRSSAKLTATGPIHITGNLFLRSNADLYVSESFVASSTVIVIDGTIDFGSNTEVHATTATPKGYLLLLSTSTSTTAFTVNSNQFIEGALYAPDGTVEINSNADILSIAGYKVHLGSNADITYDFGLRDIDFTGGASTGAEILSWREQ